MMHSFLEIYQKTLFVLILMAILVAFATPVGQKIRQSLNDGIHQTMELIDDETEIAQGNYYTIVFDGNCATSGEMEEMKCVVGKTYKLPTCAFKKDGAEFSSVWSTTSDYTNRNGKQYVTNTNYHDFAKRGETITLYAIWGYRFDLNSFLDGQWHYKPHNYGVCDIYINGECVKTNVSDFNVVLQIGDTYEIKNIRATIGHHYVGSKNNVPLAGTVNGKIRNPYLIFDTNTYTITYHANATDAVGSTAISHHTYDQSTQLTKNGFIRPGYTFLGWNTKSDGTGITYTDNQEVKNLTDDNNVNIDLYAMWQKNK